ncbi:unnamed protein product [Chondrus crispus]|uniref:Glutamine cyclotransferase n=1 Tax=Chondrus crispus TaxID=2769 RepID=R7QC36_CHOCR|nr:unnamed protein product [Chondrus crispus]CDF35010.1 unnamed protein product [Chondrus crispus]|eukprot:XP_005714829.1 unnamed protein product [Chondrus crispus]
MSSAATYEIANTDELEALGRDDVAFDTSAGLGPDESVRQEDVDATSSPKRRVCIVLVIAVISLAVIATFLGVFLSRKRTSDNSEVPAMPDPGLSAGDTSPPASEPEAPPGDSDDLKPAAPKEVKIYAINVLDSKPHDTRAFTQGFEYANGVFYESTGIRGKSSLRKVDIDSGKVIQKYEIPDMRLFGEGMTLHTTHHIFMLTWQSGRGLVFNQSTFEVIKEWKYEGEGWGLCMDRVKDEVYMSDGTDQLRVLEPDNLSELRRVNVTLRGKKVRNLNELEWVCGEVWANVWQTSQIYRIDPVSGRVKSIIKADSIPLAKDKLSSNDVLNGIAFDRASGRLWLTGKLWPAIYQVSITDDTLDVSNCK